MVKGRTGSITELEIQTNGNTTGFQLSEQILGKDMVTGTIWKLVIRIRTQFKNHTYNSITSRLES